ncbi:MAG TPA: hypothetical protein VMU42_05825 [Candidatus Sulfotelmatobacter sp.]|nr:hypothetical protein [Candidatus Sulfotelmatobacter sp.]
MSEPPSAPLRVRCRAIRDDDREAILNLFAKSGFGGTREFWDGALQRLGEHATPPGFPKYGYLLEINGAVAGMLLLIASTVTIDGRPRLRCHVSCWYVWPAFRAYATLLVSQALKHKEATYYNISPLPHTIDMLTAQGYTRYCEGRFTALPALKLHAPKVRITVARPGILMPGDDLPADEIALLLKHARYDCLSLVVAHDGRRLPFVFEPVKKNRFLRIAYLVYCRDIADFVAVAGPLGRFLARRGFACVSLDANGPVAGLLGRYAEATPKFFKGPERPRLGDLAYSERAVLYLRFGPQVGKDE